MFSFLVVLTALSCPLPSHSGWGSQCLWGGARWEEEKKIQCWVLIPDLPLERPFQGEKGVVVQTKAFICKPEMLKKKKKFGVLKTEKGLFLFLLVLLPKSHRVGRIQDWVWLWGISWTTMAEAERSLPGLGLGWRTQRESVNGSEVPGFSLLGESSVRSHSFRAGQEVRGRPCSGKRSWAPTSTQLHCPYPQHSEIQKFLREQTGIPTPNQQRR